MKKLLSLLLLIASPAFAVLMPVDTVINWKYNDTGDGSGYPGGIPTTRTNIINVTQAPYNADSTGVNDASAAINAAINAAPTNNTTTVFLPAGTYRITAGIQFVNGRNNITLKGAGMTLTTLNVVNGPTNAIVTGISTDIFGLDSAGKPAITSGATKGSTTIGVADTSSFTPGFMMKIGENNSNDQFESNLLVDIKAYRYVRRPLFKCVSKSVPSGAGTITFTPPLPFTQTHAGKAGCQVLNQGGLGFEDFTIDGANSATSQKLLYLEAQNSGYIRNVRTVNARNYGLYMIDCLNFTIVHNFFDTISHSGNNGSGFAMDCVGWSLIENNIFQEAFPNLEVNFSSAGNIIAYNWFRNNISGFFSVDMNHGAHNGYNLYEGNIWNAVSSDGFFGSNSCDTVFRNWMTGETSVYCLTWKKMTRRHNLVGNILLMPGTFGTTFTFRGDSFGQPNIGNGTDNGLIAPPWADWAQLQNALINNPGTALDPAFNTIFQEFDGGVETSINKKYNYYWFTGASDPTGGDPLPNSMYLSSKPAWFGNLTWPPIDPVTHPTPANKNELYKLIPAGYRFVMGVDPPPGGPDTTPPTVSGTPSIDTTGSILTVQFSEPVQNGAGGSAGWTINASGGAATVTFTSGAGSSIYLLGISRPIAQGETITIGYTQPGNGVVDLAPAPNALATFTGLPTTNNSTSGTVETPVITLAAGPYFGTQSTTITEGTAGAAIHFTIDGSVPTIASPTYSTTPISIPANMTVRAIATKSGLPNSAVATSAYEVVSWLITPAATKTFTIPAVTTSLPWVFTVTPAASPCNTVISLGPSAISGPTNWSIAINFNATGFIQAKNGSAFAATQSVPYTTAPVVIRVDINYAAKTFSATANNIAFATNYAFADGQPTPVSINNVGLFTSLANATISSMSFQTGPSSGRYIGLRNVTNSP